MLVNILYYVVDTYTVKATQNVLSDIGNIRTIAIYATILVSSKILSDTSFRMKERVSYTFVRRYRSLLAERILYLPMDKLQKVSIGKLSSSICEVKELGDTITDVPDWILSVAISFVYSLFLMFQEQTALSSILLIESLTIGSFVLYHKTKVRDINKATKREVNRLHSLVDRINGFLTIKAFANENRELTKYNEVGDSLLELQKKKVNRVTVMWGGVMAGGVVLDVSIIMYGYYTFQHGTFDFPQLMLFIMLSGSMLQPFYTLPNMVDEVTRLTACLDQNQEIFDLGKEYDGKISLNAFNESIRFHNVGFRYENSEEILQNINLEIQKGSKIGIYGPSGAGKSTFVNLIMRFFRVTKGKITIDGVNIDEFTNSSLRKLIGIVNNRASIFSDLTVKENISYGCPWATDTEIVEAAKLSNAHKFIMELPEGYDSIVGNNGIELSDGQCQRITIARLFLLNPEIIILDEATSKLDNASEKLIKEAIENLSKDKTVIAIAHRLTTIENSDYLVGIKNHRIVESGTKEELNKTGTLYYALLHQD